MRSLTSFFWLATVVCGVMTYLLRGSFLLLASKLGEVPDLVQTMLRMIPAAVLAALLAPRLFYVDEQISLITPRTAAAAVALVVVLTMKNVLVTVLSGVFALWLFVSGFGWAM
ncbi:MAG: AzlD domain-containing protein [Nitriliruptoraceae bacterium]